MMTMPTIIDSLEHLSRDCPVADTQLVVAIPGQSQDLFAVTDVSRQGTSVILQCQPLQTPIDSEPSSAPRDNSDSTFYENEEAEFLSLHDPQRLYEDLR
jgi:hypothetical protein